MPTAHPTNANDHGIGLTQETQVGSVLSVDEFLYRDPDTGELVCMLRDEEGFRPAMAHEVASGMPALAQAGEVGPSEKWLVAQLVDWVHDSLDMFIMKRDASFPSDDQSEWDEEDDAAVHMSPAM